MKQLLGRSPFLQCARMKTRSVNDDETSQSQDGLIIIHPFILSSRNKMKPHREVVRLCKSFTIRRRRRPAGARAQRKMKMKDMERDYHCQSVRDV